MILPLLREHPQAPSNDHSNPFNPIVGFDYLLSMESEVDIRVFNVNGQEVSILHQGIIKSGLHAISWNADKFSSGIYFIKFETNELTSLNEGINLFGFSKNSFSLKTGLLSIKNWSLVFSLRIIYGVYLCSCGGHGKCWPGNITNSCRKKRAFE